MLNTNHSDTLHRIGWLSAVLSLAWLMAGCGGGSAQTPGNIGGDGNNDPGTYSFVDTTPLQVRVGSEPAGRVVACQLQVASIQLKSSADPLMVTDLVTGPVTLEFSRLAATFEPLGVIDATNGIYNQLDVRISAATVTYLDSNGATQQKSIDTPLVGIAALNPAVAIGDIPTILDIDVDLAQTVHLDLAANQVTIGDLVINASQSNIAGQNGLPSNASRSRGAVAKSPYSDPLSSDNGAVERLVGTATQVSASQFTLVTGTAQLPLQIQFDENTLLENVSPANLDGMIVEIEGWTLDTGAIYANDLEGLFPDTGIELEGILYAHSAPGLFLIAPQDGAGAQMSLAMVGLPLSAGLTSDVRYSVSSGREDMAGLDLPFDAAHLFPGQRVELESMTGIIPGGDPATLQPYGAELMRQALNGTVANYTVGDSGMPEFDLVLNSDSYLAVLNEGTGTVHVYQTSTTDLSRLSGAEIQDGKLITIRGFLFCTDSNDMPSGTPLHFALVASSVTKAN
jgi:hypothetical protein